MTKIFTDSNGNEFELVEFIPDKDHQHQEKTYLVRPHVKEDKQTYIYQLLFETKIDGTYQAPFNETYDLTLEQAKLVSEAIEVLIEAITEPKSKTVVDIDFYIREAREALNEDN